MGASSRTYSRRTGIPPVPADLYGPSGDVNPEGLLYFRRPGRLSAAPPRAVEGQLGRRQRMVATGAGSVRKATKAATFPFHGRNFFRGKYEDESEDQRMQMRAVLCTAGRTAGRR